MCGKLMENQQTTGKYQKGNIFLFLITCFQFINNCFDFDDDLLSWWKYNHAENYPTKVWKTWVADFLIFCFEINICLILQIMVLILITKCHHSENGNIREIFPDFQIRMKNIKIKIEEFTLSNIYIKNKRSSKVTLP